MKTLNVSLSPHIRSPKTTTKIMLDVIIALSPTMIFGMIYFGWHAVLVTLVSVASCVLTEFLYEKIMKLPVTVGDLSAVVTGLILALSLYSTTPLWIPLVGGVFAILVVKMLFGGIGQNFMNPALTARCFLILSFSRIMTTYPPVGIDEAASVVDATSRATPLSIANAGGTVDLLKLIIGNHSGSIGETSAIAILIGAIYLMVRRVISPRIPLNVIGSTVAFVAVFTLFKGETAITPNFIAVQVMGGGLLAGAVFMATDYTTSPVTSWGRIVYGVVVGLITAVIRCFGGPDEGISFAIITANLLTPMIEKLSYPKPLGARGKKVK